MLVTPCSIKSSERFELCSAQRLPVVEHQPVNLVAAALHDEVVERSADRRVGALAGAGDLDFLVDVRVLVLQGRHDGAFDDVPLRRAAEDAKLRAEPGPAAADVRSGHLHARRHRPARKTRRGPWAVPTSAPW